MNATLPKPGDTITVPITDLAFQGRGIGDHDGMVVFVDGGLPGDVVEARVFKRKRRHLEAVVTEVKEPSPDRIPASCRHFGHCGGCKLQHLRYEKQLAFKAEQLRNHLIRLGGLPDPGPVTILPCPDIFGYRNKMEFAFGQDTEKNNAVGLHPRGRYWQVFDLQECYLPPPEFAEIVEVTRSFFASTPYEPYHSRHRTGFLRFLVVRIGQATGEILVNLVTTAGELSEGNQWAEQLVDHIPSIKTVLRTINDTPAQIAVGEMADIWIGDETFTEQLSGLTFTLGPTSFFQTNTRQAEQLFRTALEFAECSPDDAVLDLYSGAGAISLLVAQSVKRVTGVEIVSEAVRAARETAKANGINICTFICRDAKNYLQECLDNGSTFDLVITDPPRAGLHPKVVKRLCALQVPKLVYVSCNPATLARDLQMLCESVYSLDRIIAVDMFPHTAHIEVVARLSTR